MKRTVRYRELLAMEKKMFSDHRTAINAANRTLFSVLMSLSAICTLSMLVLSFLRSDFAPLRWSYLVLFFLQVSSILLTRRFPFLTSRPVAYYVIYGLIALLAAYSSAFVSPDYIGVIILVALFGVPVLLLDRFYRVILLEVLMAAGYLLLVIPNKSPALVPDEIVNTLLFLVMGLGVGFLFQRTRLKNFELLRRQNLDRITDPLTGLWNRRKLFEYFAACEKSPDTHAPHALAVIDIDAFKQFNDTYGHLDGDYCLERLSHAFQRFGQRHDSVFYRYGGDEFIAIILSPPPQGVSALFEELNQQIWNLRIPHSSNPGGFVTISIGVALIPPDDSPVKFEHLIEQADQALYRAKATGKNQTRVSVSPSY